MWDGLLLDCRLATLTDNGQPYGRIENAALGWHDGKITFAASQAQLPAAPETLARHVESAGQAWITPGLVVWKVSHISRAG